MILFKVMGEPIGKGRPKFSSRGKFNHAYTPKKTREYEEKIRFEFMAMNCEKMPVYPKNIPLRTELTFAFSVPKSYSKKKRAACLQGLIAHTKKPDADNLEKAINDALQGLAFEDDCQIVSTLREKIYAEEPYVEVKIYPRDWQAE